jgi:hypothetical protein
VRLLSRFPAPAATQQLEVAARDAGRRGCFCHRAVLFEERGDIALLELLDHAHARHRQRESLRDHRIEEVGLRRARCRRRLAVRRRVVAVDRAVEIAERERARHGVAELTHVARPVLGLPAADGLGGQRGGIAAELDPEGPGEQRDVAVAPPQRRELDAADRQAIEQVVAKLLLLDLLVEIATGRRDDPHIDPHRAARADPPDLGALERAQQLGLQRHVELADLVDQQRAAVRELEHALAQRYRAGERAALVTEQVGLHELRRSRRAIEHHERPARARAELMDRLGEHLLAGAGLAFDHHRNVRRRQPLDQRIQPAHRGTRAQHAAEPAAIARRRQRGTRAPLDAQLGLSDLERLATAQVRVAYRQPGADRAVG